ncbi:MAG TPA: ATP-binding protein [Arenimonas sp.]|nr:ATP-binding protein [Arenimonas sp.]
MRSLRVVACLLVAWAGAALAVLETPQLRRLGVDDGLPSSAISGIAQDRAGYLWLATRDGLARYDGVEFRIWRHAPGDPSSLPGNNLLAVHVDAADRIWVAVEGQGLRWMAADRQGFQAVAEEAAGRLARVDVWAIASSADGAVWFGSFGDGLHRLGADGRWRHFLHAPDDPRSLPSDQILALASAADGDLWIGSTVGLARWNGRDFERIVNGGLNSPMVFSLSPELDGRLWIGTSDGLYLREREGHVALAPWRDALAEGGVTAVLRDREGTRWIATRRGLDRERDGRVERVETGTALLQAFEDHEGGLWFASSDRGLLRLPAGWRQFGALEWRRGEPDSLANTPVQGIADAGNGRLWLVGSSHTLERIDPGTGRSERFLAGPEAFPDRRLWSVLPRRDGSVWVGHQLGLTRVDPETRQVRQFAADGGELSGLPGPVSWLCETPDGLLWSLHSGHGVQARDVDGRVVHSLRMGTGPNQLPSDIRQLLAGPDGRLWLLGGTGLLRVDAGTPAVQPVPGDAGDRVLAARYVPPDRVWLSRQDALEAWRWRGDRLELLQRFGGDDGIPAVDSGGIAVDRSGALWLTTPRGLLRFDPIARQARLYGNRDGLRSQEFVARPPLILDNGIGAAASIAGLMLFDPERIRASAVVPRLSIDAILLRRGEDDIALPASEGALQLQAEDRDLRVAVRLLSFADARNHRYRFWLENYDSDWVETGARGERVFPRLDPGRYRLRVIAAAADGPWSAPRELDVWVEAPWWRRPAALAGFVLLAAIGVVALARGYRARVRRRAARQLGRQRQRLLEQGSEAKSRFVATLGHEIRTPMTGVLGMAELLLASDLPPPARTKVAQIQGAGQHLLRLLNDALDLARIEAGKLELVATPFDLQALLDEVVALLRPLAEAKGLQFILQRGPDTPGALLGDVARVRQILLNLGNNAIKFTERGEVALRTSALAVDGVRIEVSDSGPGLSAEQQARLFQRFEQADGARTAARYGGSGLGLAICQELAEAMGGSIDVVSAPGQGASFRVALPLPRVAIESVAREPIAASAPDSGRRRVLLVEDDPLLAEVLGGLLEGLGHRVTHASQALAALSALAAGDFDLAFLDLDLPGMDGLQLARLIRAQGRALPLLALTARSDPDAEAQALAAGMDGFQRKPVTAAMLAAAIAEAVKPRSE